MASPAAKDIPAVAAAAVAIVVISALATNALAKPFKIRLKNSIRFSRLSTGPAAIRAPERRSTRFTELNTLPKNPPTLDVAFPTLVLIRDAQPAVELTWASNVALYARSDISPPFCAKF